MSVSSDIHSNCCFMLQKLGHKDPCAQRRLDLLLVHLQTFVHLILFKYKSVLVYIPLLQNSVVVVILGKKYMYFTMQFMSYMK